MSDFTGDIKKRIQEEAELKRKQKELDRIRTDEAYERLQKAKERAEFFKDMKIGQKNPELLRARQQANVEFIEASKTQMPFIHNDFADIVPYFAKNLILIGARTGEGKSTTAANIIYTTVLHKKRVLVITNEETAQDIYNRITCLIKEWTYAPKDFTPEQVAFMNAMIERLEDWITVIDDNHMGYSGVTTTLEGVCGILDNLVNHNLKYDSIVIDYLQNISKSSSNPKREKWQVLQEFMEKLVNFKNQYLAPVVMLAQLHNVADDKASFEARLKGFRGMMEPMTCVLEVRPDKRNFRSEWIIHKSRWPIEQQGFFTGWYKGRYVSENNKKYQEWKNERLMTRARNFLEVEDEKIDKL